MDRKIAKCEKNYKNNCYGQKAIPLDSPSTVFFKAIFVKSGKFAVGLSSKKNASDVPFYKSMGGVGLQLNGQVKYGDIVVKSKRFITLEHNDTIQLRSIPIR